MKKGLRIGVAEYHSIFRHSLQAWTASLNEVKAVHSVRTPTELFRLLETQPLHLLVLDLGQSWPDTLLLLRTLRQRYPALSIVLLLDEPSAQHLRQALEAGARALLTRADDPAEYARALEAAASGITHLSRLCLQQFSPLAPAPRVSTHEGLTARETQIVQCLVRQLTSEQIASELAISLYTVKTHRRNILQKMNLRNTIGLLRLAAEWERQA